MFNKMSLKVKLIVLFLLVGLVPMGIIGLLSYNSAQGEIENEAYMKLDLFADIADDQLDAYFLERQGDATVLANTRDVYQSLNILAGGEHRGETIGEAGDITDPMWQERLDILEGTGSTVVEEYGYGFIFITNPEGVVVYSSREEVIGADLGERDYVQGALGGSVSWSELFYSDVIHENCMVVSVPVLSGGHSGQLVGVLGLLFDQQQINNIVHAGVDEVGASGDSYLVDADGTLLTETRLGEYTQNAALQQNINTRAVELLSGPIRDGNWEFNAQDLYPDYLGNPVLGSLEVTRLGDQPVGLIVEIDEAEAFAGVAALRNMIIPIIGVAAVVVAFIAYFVAMTIVRPVQKVSDLTKELAEGDFTVKADIKSRDEIGQMAGNLNNTIDVLSDTLGRVQEASENVSYASSEISSGNQDLSQRTEEQASSLEEVSSTVEEMSSSLETSSANATEADKLSHNTMESVRQGETVVKDMQGAMDEITKGGQEISEIISTVNDIAFQTNLLALNAAVEAARAGEQGRGFAVVAAEVRNLAGRSAESAKEIEKLIKDSISRMDRGNTLMGDTEKVLQEIVTNTQKTSDVVGEIAASLQEQSAASGEIRNAIEELNQVTQQNSALVEEIASSSENMNSEAVELADKVNFFKISENGLNNHSQQFSSKKRQDSKNNDQNTQDKKTEMSKKDPRAAAIVAGSGENGPQIHEEDFEKF